MSGYLQRLATSASNPERRLQPLVSALYGPRHEPVGKEETAVLAPRPAAATLDTKATTDAANPRPRALAVDQPAEPASLLVEATTVRPPEKTPSMRAKPAPQQERIAEAEALKPQQGPSIVRPGATQKLLVSEDFVARFEKPDELPQQRAVANTRSGENPAGAPLNPPRAPLPAVRSGQLAAQNGGDEIQIHIGRIEVIAAQQIAPRPAPGPTRRGPTLEDYLKRHDRRAT
jgi:hypothetical protein